MMNVLAIVVYRKYCMCKRIKKSGICYKHENFISGGYSVGIRIKKQCRCDGNIVCKEHWTLAHSYLYQQQRKTKLSCNYPNHLYQ